MVRMAAIASRYPGTVGTQRRTISCSGSDGEKTAASLLARFGTLDALLDAAASRDPHLAGVAGKLNAARDYLTVAPRVVGTVRTLPLPTVDTALPSRPPDAERLLELAERWGIDNVLGRSVKALGSPP